MGVGIGIKQNYKKGMIMTILTDGRGMNKVALKKKNRAIVREWKNNNPKGTMQGCINDTGLSYKTIVGHILAIQKED